MRTPLCEQFGIEFPIFAFSHCRDVVAAVSRAGGMGVLGAVGFSPRRLEIELDWIDEHVDGKPYGVDFIMPAKTVDTGTRDIKKLGLELDAMVPPEYPIFIEDLLTKHHVPPLSEDTKIGKVILGTEATSLPLIDIALAHSIKLLVNALGPPPKHVIDLAHDHDVAVGALIGTTAQAQRQVANGVDLIIAQGSEAGGHTGEISTMVLVSEVVDAVAPAPVLAAGGIGNGRQMAAALALGAQGVWTGSIWLTVAEADTTPVVMEKLLAATSSDTVRSRSLTGKPVRQLRTAWTEAWDDPSAPRPLQWPLQTMIASPALARIERSRSKELSGTPVGEIVGTMNAVRPARDVVFDLVEGYIETVQRLVHLGEDAESH